MKGKTIGSLVIISALSLVVMPCAHAGLVSVFLDDGAHAPGSSNSGIPYISNDRDTTWDVAVGAESGLGDIGAAVMEVRMVTFNVNGDSRGVNTGGGNGLAVTTGANDAWMDGGSREAVLFQLAFYSDVAKTAEITGLDITFKAIIARVNGINLGMDAHAGLGALALEDTGGTLDDYDVKLGGTVMLAVNDAANASIGSELGLQPDESAHQYFTMNSAGNITFGEEDSFWLRRRNLSGAGDAAYQLGAVTFEVIPEPASLGLVGFIGVAAFVCRRFLRM